MLFLFGYFPTAAIGSGITGGIAAGKELAILAIATSALSLLLGIALVIPFKKKVKDWQRNSLTLMVAVMVFLAIWVAYLNGYAKLIFKYINSIFGTYY